MGSVASSQNVVEMMSARPVKSAWKVAVRETLAVGRMRTALMDRCAVRDNALLHLVQRTVTVSPV